MPSSDDLTKAHQHELGVLAAAVTAVLSAYRAGRRPSQDQFERLRLAILPLHLRMRSESSTAVANLLCSKLVTPILEAHAFLIRDTGNNECLPPPSTFKILLGTLLFHSVLVGCTSKTPAVLEAAEQVATKLLRMGTLRCYCKLLPAYLARLPEPKDSIDFIPLSTPDPPVLNATQIIVGMGYLISAWSILAGRRITHIPTTADSADSADCGSSVTAPDVPARCPFRVLLVSELQNTQVHEHLARGALLLLLTKEQGMKTKADVLDAIRACSRCMRACAQENVGGDVVRLVSNLYRYPGPVIDSYGHLRGPCVQFLLLAQAVRTLAEAKCSIPGTISSAARGTDRSADGSAELNAESAGAVEGTAYSMYGLPAKLAKTLPILGPKPRALLEGNIKHPQDLTPLLRGRGGARQHRVLHLYEEVFTEALAVVELAAASLDTHGPAELGNSIGGAGMAGHRPRWSCIIGPRAAYEICMQIAELAIASGLPRDWDARSETGDDTNPPPGPQLRIRELTVLHIGMRALVAAKKLVMGPLATRVGTGASARDSTAATADHRNLQPQAAPPLPVEWWQSVSRLLHLNVDIEDISPELSLSTSLQELTCMLFDFQSEDVVPDTLAHRPTPALDVALSAGIVSAAESCLRNMVCRLSPSALVDVMIAAFLRSPVFIRNIMAFGPRQEVASFISTIKKTWMRKVDKVEADAAGLLKMQDPKLRNDPLMASIPVEKHFSESVQNLRSFEYAIRYLLPEVDLWKTFGVVDHDREDDDNGKDSDPDSGPGSSGSSAFPNPLDDGGAAASRPEQYARHSNSLEVVMRRPEVQQLLHLTSHMLYSWLPAMVSTALALAHTLQAPVSASDKESFIGCAGVAMKWTVELLFAECPMGTSSRCITFANVFDKQDAAAIRLTPGELSAPSWRTRLLREMQVLELLGAVLHFFGSATPEVNFDKEFMLDSFLDALLAVALVLPEDLAATVRSGFVKEIKGPDDEASPLIIAAAAASAAAGYTMGGACSCPTCQRERPRLNANAGVVGGGVGFLASAPGKPTWGPSTLGALVNFAAKCDPESGASVYTEQMVIALDLLRRNNQVWFLCHVVDLANIRRLAPKRIWLRTPAEVAAFLQTDPEAAPPRFCANPRCTNLIGLSEAALLLTSCGGCRAVSYCSRMCQQHHWSMGHKHDCAALRLQRLHGGSVD